MSICLRKGIKRVAVIRAAREKRIEKSIHMCATAVGQRQWPAYKAYMEDVGEAGEQAGFVWNVKT